MKYLLLLVFALTPMANAESWIRLNVPEGSIRYIDRDSIKKEGDFAYYRMKDDSVENYSIIKFKHDCKYNARQIIAYSKYDTRTYKLVVQNNFPNDMFEYPRSAAMIKVEKMVCR